MLAVQRAARDSAPDLPVSTGRFSRELRLLTPAEYQHVFNDPHRCKSSDNCFMILACVNDKHHPRLGLAIAKKHVKSAVARNRIKRIIRESFRSQQQAMDAVDIVVLARAGLDKKNNLQLNESLQRHWSQLKQKCNVSSSL